MTTRRNPVLASMLACLLILLGGCASLPELGQRDESPDMGPAVATPPSRQDGDDLLTQRIAARAVMLSPELDPIGERIRNLHSPVIRRMGDGHMVVVFDLNPDEESGTGVALLPAVAVVLPQSGVKPADVFMIQSNLYTGMKTISNLDGKVLHSEEMKADRVAELESLRERIPQSCASDWRARPLYECDEELTEPEWYCWCTEQEPGGFNMECVSLCSGACSWLPSPYTYACLAVCLGCWTNGYCVEWDCMMVYPCGWW